MPTIAVKLKDEGRFTHADGTPGQTPGGDQWSDVQWLPEGECEHETTMCARCKPQWAFDHHLGEQPAAA